MYQVQHGTTVAAYLPVQDQTLDADCRDGDCNEPLENGEKLSRLMTLKPLHISLGHLLQPLMFNAMQDL